MRSKIHLLNPSRFCLLAAVAFIGLPHASAAEQTLEMQLQPTQSKSAGSSANTRGGSPNRSVRLSSRAMSAPRPDARVAIGRVGYVQPQKTSIYRSRSARSSALFTVPKGTPLAVVNTSGSWYGVLMVDGSTGWVPSSDLTISDLQVMAPSASLPAPANEIIRQAYSYRGIPYVWGGASRSGTDCSGFVKQVWADMGRALPRTAREQALVGTPVGMDQLQPGDRIYFATKGGAVDHTGIYIGDDMFIHASSGRGMVDVDRLSSYKYASDVVGCRRG